MSKVEIPKHLQPKLGSEMKMDIHWVDVLCNDSTKHYGVVVRGGQFITGFKNDTNGEGTVPFTSNQIINIRRQTLFKWWPFW